MTGPDQPHDPAKHLDAVTAHVERCFGPVAGVFHELASDEIHLDILMVEPNAERPWWTLVTSGMSEQPMHLPEGVTAPRLAELVMQVAPDHAMQKEDWEDERNYWPVRQLKQLARLPKNHNSWLGPGHTIAGDPPQPVATGLPFCGMAVLELLDADQRRLPLDGGDEIAFYQVLALHPEELSEKLAGKLDLDAMFDDEVFRVNGNDRQLLADDEAEMEAIVRRGQRCVHIAALLLAAIVGVDITAALTAGDAFPVARTLFAAFLLVRLLQGAVIARWALVVLSLAGAALATKTLWSYGPVGWAGWALVGYIPMLLVTAALLAAGPGVRVWFGSKRL